MGSPKRRRQRAKKRESKRREQRRREQAPAPLGPDPRILAELLSMLGDEEGLAALLGEDGPEPPVELEPRGLELCSRPIYLTRGLQRIDDPLATLGLDPGREHDADAIRAAWRAAMEACRPERDPDAARRLTEARDYLLDPRRVLERYIGKAWVPDPRAYGLPVLEEESEAEDLAPTYESHLAEEVRLLGQLVLYAFVAEELEH